MQIAPIHNRFWIIFTEIIIDILCIEMEMNLCSIGMCLGPERKNDRIYSSILIMMKKNCEADRNSDNLKEYGWRNAIDISLRELSI